jgi:hypothetical protein
MGGCWWERVGISTWKPTADGAVSAGGMGLGRYEIRRGDSDGGCGVDMTLTPTSWGNVLKARFAQPC